jgi:hypothetical protein
MRKYYDDKRVAELAKDWHGVRSTEGKYPKSPSAKLVPGGFIEVQTLWVIHPDSYSFFEPQEGDVYTHEGMEREYYGAEEVCHEDLGVEEFKVWFARECVIIQRNNLPFFMPKKEA